MPGCFQECQEATADTSAILLPCVTLSCGCLSVRYLTTVWERQGQGSPLNSRLLKNLKWLPLGKIERWFASVWGSREPACRMATTHWLLKHTLSSFNPITEWYRENTGVKPQFRSWLKHTVAAATLDTQGNVLAPFSSSTPASWESQVSKIKQPEIMLLITYSSGQILDPQIFLLLFIRSNNIYFLDSLAKHILFIG